MASAMALWIVDIVIVVLLVGSLAWLEVVALVVRWVVGRGIPPPGTKGGNSESSESVLSEEKSMDKGILALRCHALTRVVPVEVLLLLGRLSLCAAEALVTMGIKTE